LSAFSWPRRSCQAFKSGSVTASWSSCYRHPSALVRVQPDRLRRVFDSGQDYRRTNTDVEPLIVPGCATAVLRKKADVSLTSAEVSTK
jgi:hypothetical protein